MSEASTMACGDYVKYLGLPTMVGRSKYETFRGLKENNWKRMNSWRHTLLSIVGKEALIKAILVYAPLLYECFSSAQVYVQ